jgi:4-oxalocrotonate tautomerase
MPIIQVNLIEGRTDEQKKLLAQRITDSVVEILGSRKEAVRILFHEMGPYDFWVGGNPIAERNSSPPS